MEGQKQVKLQCLGRKSGIKGDIHLSNIQDLTTQEGRISVTSQTVSPTSSVHSKARAFNWSTSSLDNFLIIAMFSHSRKVLQSVNFLRFDGKEAGHGSPRGNEYDTILSALSSCKYIRLSRHLGSLIGTTLALKKDRSRVYNKCLVYVSILHTGNNKRRKQYRLNEI
ncbi:hypothetical protein H5410_040340 [Solanum commersonii]|uniref:Uncharacterized protein n=1 Tax=Solanum commersonii TaxID=4109 RepID=A0A9J5XPV0_SOLCO|nr:hypothetical protein H5410_040340 [Solanum commersonii]